MWPRSTAFLIGMHCSVCPADCIVSFCVQGMSLKGIKRVHFTCNRSPCGGHRTSRLQTANFSKYLRVPNVVMCLTFYRHKWHKFTYSPSYTVLLPVCSFRGLLHYNGSNPTHQGTNIGVLPKFLITILSKYAFWCWENDPRIGSWTQWTHSQLGLEPEIYFQDLDTLVLKVTWKFWVSKSAVLKISGHSPSPVNSNHSKWARSLFGDRVRVITAGRTFYGVAGSSLGSFESENWLKSKNWARGSTFLLAKLLSALYIPKLLCFAEMSNVIVNCSPILPLVSWVLVTILKVLHRWGVGLLQPCHSS